MIGSRRFGDRTRIARFFGVLAVLASGVPFGAALAQPTQSVSQSIAASEYPAAFVARPINLRAGTIRVDTRYQHMEDQFLGGTVATNQVAVGLALGVTDSVEIGITHVRPTGLDYYNAGALVANFTDGNRQFGDIAIYGRYAFLDAEDFKLSGEIGVVLPTHDYGYWQFEFGLPLRARLGEHFALDLLPEIRIAFPQNSAGSNNADLSLNVPVAGVLQPTNNFWIAGRSGMYWTDFKLETFYFPAILETGFTVDHAGAAVLDIAVQGGFPQLFVPGGNDPVHAEWWMLRVNLTGYLAF